MNDTLHGVTQLDGKSDYVTKANNSFKSLEDALTAVDNLKTGINQVNTYFVKYISRSQFGFKKSTNSSPAQTCSIH